MVLEWTLRTKGQESVYDTCACVIHTNLPSYMCISVVSHFTLKFARGTCALVYHCSCPQFRAAFSADSTKQTCSPSSQYNKQ